MAQRTGGRKPAGDATGRKAQELAEQHREAVAARADQLTLAQQQQADESAEVVDLTAGLHPAPGTRQPGMEGVDIDPDGIMHVEGQEEVPVQTNATSIVGQGPESPSNVPGATPYDQRTRDIVDTENPVTDRVLGANDVVDRGAADAVRIRVNQDLPEVTIGAGNHYDFKEGRQYLVPRHVAAHLEEKGVLWH